MQGSPVSVEPEDYSLATVLVTYQRFTVDESGTAAAAGTVTFELVHPTKIKTDEGIDITIKPVIGYLGDNGAMRRESRVGEEGVELVCLAEDFGVDQLVYRATFNLTDGLGSGRIIQKPVTIPVTTNDIVLNELT